MRKYFIQGQGGIVSIIVSVIIMIVLTLIAIAFAQIMRREQQQALDRQLSSQAYYAAETAVNDAAYILAQNPEQLTNSTGGCESSSSGPLSQNVVSEELGIEYSCVIIDSTPTQLRYDSIKTDQSVQVELTPIDNTRNKRQLSEITLAWRDLDGNGRSENTSSNPPFDLPQLDQWGEQPGILRVEIAPVANIVGRDTRDQLLDRRKVFYMYPTTNGSPTVSWSATDNGELVRSRCGAALDTTCSITITDLPVNPNGDANMYYIMRLRTVYDEAEVVVDGSLVGGGQAYFQGAQTEIDATGRAGDVLRRISARVAVERSYPIPEYGTQGFGGVCKRLELVDVDNVFYDCY